MEFATRFTFLAFELNAAVDRGQSLDVEEVGQRVGDGTLFDWLGEAVPELDLSPYDPEKAYPHPASSPFNPAAKDRGRVLFAFQELRNAADARRKFGTEKNGLCLLVAYCLEVLRAGLVPAEVTS